jgi:hypothetical protein
VRLRVGGLGTFANIDRLARLEPARAKLEEYSVVIRRVVAEELQGRRFDA